MNQTDPLGLWTVQIGGTVNWNLPLLGKFGGAGSFYGGLVFSGSDWGVFGGGGIGGGASIEWGYSGEG